MIVYAAHFPMPLLLRMRSSQSNNEFDADAPTCYEMLDTTLTLDQERFVLERRTKVTSVGRETTDDT